MADNLRPCQACGLPIAKKARKCPHCGYKNKKKHPFLLLVLIVIAVAIAVNAFRDRRAASVKVPDPTEAEIQVTIPTTEEFTQTTEAATEASEASTETTNPETTEAPTETTEPPTEEPAETGPQLIDGMRPEFKEAMDSYEEFYIEYCDFMKKYNEDPSNVLLLAEYLQLVAKAEKMEADFAKWDDGSMNNTELKYYMDVSNRVMQMLLDAAA